MDKKAITVLIILIILGVCIAGLLFVYLNPGILSKCGFYKDREGDSKQRQQIQLNEGDDYYKTLCGNEGYPCFMYPELKQQKGYGYSEDVGQIRLEPCPKPKPVCPICKDEVKQIHGYGYSEEVPQVLIGC